MRGRFLRYRGEVVCNAEVTKITVEHGRAIGVQVHDQFVRGPSRGAGRCSRKASLRPAGHLRRAATEGTGQDGRFRRVPGTVKVDYAFTGPVPWSAPPPYAPGTVHVSDSYEELVIGQAQLSTGHIPERPFLLVGQMTTADPTRSPEGTESVWAYPHVPQRVLGAAGGNLTGSWTPTKPSGSRTACKTASSSGHQASPSASWRVAS